MVLYEIYREDGGNGITFVHAVVNDALHDSNHNFVNWHVDSYFMFWNNNYLQMKCTDVASSLLDKGEVYNIMW